MTTTTNQLSEIRNAVTDLKPAVVLLELLSRLVPEFLDVRQRHRESCAEFFAKLDNTLTHAGESFPLDVRLFSEFGRVEAELNSDQEFSQLFSGYWSGLTRIASVIGNPGHLADLMWQEDHRAALIQCGIVESVITAMKHPDARVPGSPAAEAHQFLDYGFNLIAGVDSAADMLDLPTAREARKRVSSIAERLERVAAKDSDSFRIVSWLLVKVQGWSAEKVAELRVLEVQSIRREITHANSSLHLSPGSGRPRNDANPLLAWRSIRF